MYILILKLVKVKAEIDIIWCNTVKYIKLYLYINSIYFSIPDIVTIYLRIDYSFLKILNHQTIVSFASNLHSRCIKISKVHLHSSLILNIQSKKLRSNINVAYFVHQKQGRIECQGHLICFRSTAYCQNFQRNRMWNWCIKS